MRRSLPTLRPARWRARAPAPSTPTPRPCAASAPSASQRGCPSDVAAFRPAHVYAFLKVIADSGVSLGTRHRRFRETRAFFSWCTPNGRLRAEPLHGHPERQGGAEGDPAALVRRRSRRSWTVCDPGRRSSAAATGPSSCSSSTPACATRSCTSSPSPTSILGGPPHPHPPRERAQAAGGALRRGAGSARSCGRTSTASAASGRGTVVPHDLTLGGAARAR